MFAATIAGESAEHAVCGARSLQRHCARSSMFYALPHLWVRQQHCRPLEPPLLTFAPSTDIICLPALCGLQSPRICCHYNSFAHPPSPIVLCFTNCILPIIVIVSFHRVYLSNCSFIIKHSFIKLYVPILPS